MNSPCTKVCVMDEDGRYCLGCKRTLGEIAGWGGMSDTDRQAILDELPKRAAAAAGPQRPAQGGSFF